MVTLTMIHQHKWILKASRGSPPWRKEGPVLVIIGSAPGFMWEAWFGAACAWKPLWVQPYWTVVFWGTIAERVRVDKENYDLGAHMWTLTMAWQWSRSGQQTHINQITLVQLHGNDQRGCLVRCLIPLFLRGLWQQESFGLGFLRSSWTIWDGDEVQHYVGDSGLLLIRQVCLEPLVG